MSMCSSSGLFEVRLPLMVSSINIQNSRNSIDRSYLEYPHLGTRSFCLQVGYCTQLILSVRFTLHRVVLLHPVPEPSRASTGSVETGSVEPPTDQQPSEGWHKAGPRGEKLCVVETAADRQPLYTKHMPNPCVQTGLQRGESSWFCQFNVEVTPDLSVAVSPAPSVCTPTLAHAPHIRRSPWISH